MSRFLQTDGTYKLVSPDMEKGRILINWALLEHLVHDLAVSGDLNCPLKFSPELKNSCPIMTSSCGRQLEYVNENGEMCLYGETLYGLGVIDQTGASCMQIGRLSDADPRVRDAESKDITVLREQTGKCDFCGNTVSLISVTIISVETLNAITKRGFIPSRMRVSEELARSGIARRALWAAILDTYQASDWGVCSPCKSELEEFLG
jgi:hypothetical protein